jgi:hypothetical protein
MEAASRVAVLPGVARCCQVLPGVASYGWRQPVGGIAPGLVIAISDGPGSTDYYAVDARRAHSGPNNGGCPLRIPTAYRLDDLTYAGLWAASNLEQALLDDDAALDRAHRRTLAGSRADRPEIGGEELDDLSPVSRMWLGSQICADHITGNLGRFGGVPAFWTREQRGKEASTWLLSAHKLEYLRTTSGRGSDAPSRVFCVPEAVVTQTSRAERTLLLLAVALMEAHGVTVHVTSDPSYGQVPGSVRSALGRVS